MAASIICPRLAPMAILNLQLSKDPRTIRCSTPAAVPLRREKNEEGIFNYKAVGIDNFPQDFILRNMAEARGHQALVNGDRSNGGQISKALTLHGKGYHDAYPRIIGINLSRCFFLVKFLSKWCLALILNFEYKSGRFHKISTLLAISTGLRACTKNPL